MVEAKRNLEKVSFSSEFLFLFGVGLGYFLEVLSETEFECKLLYAWEPKGGSLEHEIVKKKLKLFRISLNPKKLQFKLFLT